jgi:tetratricopeptide (TPR) repeat protein
MASNFINREKYPTFAVRKIISKIKKISYKMAESKKDQLNVGDALTQSEAFIIKYQKQIIGIVLAVAIIIAGYFLYKRFYAEPHEEKAQAALFPGQKYFEVDDYASALNGDKNGYIGFLKVEDQYSGTKAANLAKAYAGICYANLGKYDKAAEELDGFDGDDEMVSPAIKGALGNCYAHLGKMDKATDCLMSAAKEADSPSLSPIFLVQAGQIFESLGKYDKAIEAYQMVKDKYFQSYQAMDIDKYIERATLEKK